MTSSVDTRARFEGKRVLISGATSGIGLAGALRLYEEGAELILTGTDRSRLDRLQTRLPRSRVLFNDASDPSAVEELLKAASPQLDGLWLNAGFARIGGIKDITEKSFDEMMAVNARAPFLQLAGLRSLLHPGSSVVLTSSTSAYEGNPATSIYAATKAALIAGARSWAEELGPHGVRVNTLVPGAIETHFRAFLGEDSRIEFERSIVANTSLGRIGTAEEAAAAALFLLSDDSSYVTGTQLFVDGGLLKR